MDDLEAVRTIVEVLKNFDEIEQARILRWTTEKLSITFSAEGGATNPSVPYGGVNPPVGGANRNEAPTDIRTFVQSKSPSSDNQFAATVAYYYAFEAPPEEHKDAIVPSDLTDACRKVGRNRLGDPAKTLRNAHQVGYFDKADRGTFKLNTVGENLVAITLPSRGDSPARAPKKVVRKKALGGKPASKAVKKTVKKAALRKASRR